MLLKECLDVQQRFGVGDANGETAIEYVTSRTESSASDAVISERLVRLSLLF